MRNAEWINLLFFSFFLALSLMRSFSKQIQRIKAILIGACGILLVISVQKLQIEYSSVVRDWLPAPLMLFAYWQAGNLFRSPNEQLQNVLVDFDRKVLGPIGRAQGPALLNSYLELAYLFCYPLVPFGLTILYLLNMRQHSDFYWTTVLIPTYICHAMVPFTQTLPPWMLEPENRNSSVIRRFNFWIIKHASIHANTLPSAHVTASLAAAVVLLQFISAAGFIFLWIAFSIAIAAVAGRYHYTLDVIAATILVIVIFFLLRVWL
jgi:hypothetical protein